MGFIAFDYKESGPVKKRAYVNLDIVQHMHLSTAENGNRTLAIWYMGNASSPDSVVYSVEDDIVELDW